MQSIWGGEEWKGKFHGDPSFTAAAMVERQVLYAREVPRAAFL
jgi:hypothetical protein